MQKLGGLIGRGIGFIIFLIVLHYGTHLIAELLNVTDHHVKTIYAGGSFFFS